MRSVVVLPTYNEVENLQRFCDLLAKAAPTTDLLVVDDDSPDGTGRLADRLAEENPRITVMHRSDKSGLAGAYRDGFGAVLDPDFPHRPHGPYDVVFSMDADLSHDPELIADFLDIISNGADAVIGSRYVRGGGTTDWPVRRQLLSKWGNAYTRVLLRLSPNDCTSGYRAYRSEALAAIDPAGTRAEGYAFLTELVRRLDRIGAHIEETPIIFRDRTHGRSKMSGRIIVESMILVTRWGLADRLGRLSRPRGR
ncbi:MAG: polyprenol monophosphomannose synthase [Actinomycetota bacterium]